MIDQMDQLKKLSSRQHEEFTFKESDLRLLSREEIREYESALIQMFKQNSPGGVSPDQEKKMTLGQLYEL